MTQVIEKQSVNEMKVKHLFLLHGGMEVELLSMNHSGSVNARFTGRQTYWEKGEQVVEYWGEWAGRVTTKLPTSFQLRDWVETKAFGRALNELPLAEVVK